MIRKHFSPHSTSLHPSTNFRYCTPTSIVVVLRLQTHRHTAKRFQDDQSKTPYTLYRSAITSFHPSKYTQKSQHNMTSIKERMPTISMGCVSSFGFLMAILAGTNPEFIEITAVDGDVLVNSDGDELEISQTGLGVASSSIFSTDNDSLWGLSRIFFYISIVVITVIIIESKKSRSSIFLLGTVR